MKTIRTEKIPMTKLYKIYEYLKHIILFMFLIFKGMRNFLKEFPHIFQIGHIEKRNLKKFKQQ